MVYQPFQGPPLDVHEMQVNGVLLAAYGTHSAAKGGKSARLEQAGFAREMHDMPVYASRAGAVMLFHRPRAVRV